ncbi:MAG: aminoacyl-tRNA hydrolase [Bacteroidetes bacterium]|nr:aminoacyl-tRNA hydrolase [Bacteroidota bacterium]
MLEDWLHRGLDKECEFKTSRSSGKGGQNVNKLETRVELWFNIEASAILTPAEKKRLLEKLAARLVNNNTLHLQEQSARTQLQNKDLILKKFYKRLDLAMKQEKPRKATKPSKSAVEKRLKSKKIASERKEQRRNFF